MSTRASPPATTLRGRRLLLVRAAWVIVAALALGLFFASVPGYVSDFTELGQADWMGAPVEGPTEVVLVFDLLGVLASFATAILCLTLAVVLFWRRSDDWMVVFVSSYLLAYGTVFAGPLEWAEGFYPWWPPVTIDVVLSLFFTTPTIALFVLFPDGRFVPRWTSWLVLASALLVPAILFLPLTHVGPFLSMVLLGAISAQVYRYRRVSTPTGRQQIKWVISGILLWLVLMGLLSVPYSLVQSMPPGNPLPWWALAGSTGWWLTLAIVPLSLGIAILRYRLYDIDVVINRTLVYGSLTVMLALVYFGGVASLQYTFRVITGHADFPQLAIVVSTLAIAALFNPLRRRIQSLIDRRFYRGKYDATKTLGAFSAKLRDETDLDTLSNDLVSVVRETMQPEHVSLWLRSGTAFEDRQPD